MFSRHLKVGPRTPIDSPVRRRQTFDALLNAALAADTPDVGGRMAPPPITPFWFVNLHFPPPVPGAGTIDGHTSRRHAGSARPSSRALHPSRELTAAEQRALAAMVALGAKLDEHFTESELRTAYRALARRYHPDRHPHCSGPEQARWAQKFALLCDSYERLRRVARTPRRSSGD